MFSGSPGPGVSDALARERAAVVRELRYDVSFVIPSDRRQPVEGRVVAQLVLKSLTASCSTSRSPPNVCVPSGLVVAA